MKLKGLFVFCVIFCLMLFSAGVLFAQEETKEVAKSEVVASIAQTEPASAETPAEPVQEVKTVSIANEEQSNATTETVAKESEAAQEVDSTEWVWGEVVSTDANKKEVVIKHLNYDTYEEVQTTITLNDKTLLENAADLSAISSGDHVTVDYKVQDGANVAGLIVVEKKEAATENTTETAAEAPKEEVPSVEAAATTQETQEASSAEPVIASESNQVSNQV